jgi:hypothetical protein
VTKAQPLEEKCTKNTKSISKNARNQPILGIFIYISIASAYPCGEIGCVQQAMGTPLHLGDHKPIAAPDRNAVSRNMAQTMIAKQTAGLGHFGDTT